MAAGRRFLKGLGYAVLALVLIASLGSVLEGHPFLLEVEQSNSMFPLLQRGDIALVLPLPSSDAHVGSIVMYHPTKGPLTAEGYIVHRIVGGSPATGYLTKGDNNPTTDQAAKATGRVPPTWIDGIIPTIGSQPLRVPLVGYLAIWAATYLKHLYALPAAGALLALLVAISDRHRAGHRHRSGRQTAVVIALVTSALVLAAVTAVVTLATSEREVAPYKVAATEGVMNGSTVGVLREGQIVHVKIGQLQNTGLFPLAVTVTSSDPNAFLAPRDFWLPTAHQRTVEMTVRAKGAGMHSSVIWIGLFPPLLPPGVLWELAARSYWLALAAASAAPTLPFFVYLMCWRMPRRAVARLGRRALRPLWRVLPLP